MFCFILQICKKLGGQGKGTAEWCTNISNEFGHILSFVFTCEESVTMLRGMADGLMVR